MIKELFNGLSFFMQGVRFIRANRLSKFYFAPFVMAVILFFLNLNLSSNAATYIASSLSQFLDQSFVEEYLPILPDMLYWLIYIAIRIIVFFIIAYLSGFFILILMSPILSYLSKKTEQILTGEKADGVLSVLAETIRGISVALRSFIVETLLSLLLFVVGFVPVAGFVVPFISIGLSNYFYAFSFADYFFERRGLSYAESKKAMQPVKWRLMGVSIPFTCFLFIPFIGTFMAAMCSIPATAATVIALHAKNEVIKY